MKIFLLCIFCLLVSGCFVNSSPIDDLPVSYDPNAPTEWKLGWRHGCESGLSAYGNNWYKSRYKFNQDITMINDKYYSRAWNDSFNYCRAYVNRRLAGDSKAYEERPGLLGGNISNITNEGGRDIAPTQKQGLLEGKSNRGFFADVFEANVPGQGSTAWGGAGPYVGCDWLNRCGDDKPKDPIDALLGQ